MKVTGQLEVITPAGQTEFEVEDLIGRWAGNQEKAVMAMLAVQDRYNWLPPEALNYISRRLEVPAGQLYHIATFYKFFSLTPRGKHILQLCTGTACHILGARRVADALKREHGLTFGRTSDDGLFTLEQVNCVGACSMGPVLVVDGNYHGNVNQSIAGAIVKKLARQATTEGDHGQN